MNKREQKFQTLFNHYMKDVFLKKKDFFAGAFELKDSRGSNSIPFAEVKDHQIDALLAVKGNGLVYKIDDSSYGQKPFDSIAFKNCPAFIVIKYPSCFVLIDPETWQLESKRSKRRSLTESRARLISNLTIEL